MKLFYRGIPYTLQSTKVATRETQTQATYRGVSYSIHQMQNPPVSQPKNLTYRGVPYIKQSRTQSKLTPAIG